MAKRRPGALINVSIEYVRPPHRMGRNFNRFVKEAMEQVLKEIDEKHER